MRRQKTLSGMCAGIVAVFGQVNIPDDLTTIQSTNDLRQIYLDSIIGSSEMVQACQDCKFEDGRLPEKSYQGQEEACVRGHWRRLS